MMNYMFEFWRDALRLFFSYIGFDFAASFLVCIISYAFLVSLLSRRR